jgi:pimeloyl-ACP methyl ester carboxylesterase
MESIQVRTADEVRLSATHVTGPGRSGNGLVAVLAHGITVSSRQPVVRRVAQRFARRCAVLTFDFRGHGRSGGRTSAGDEEVLDLDAAVGLARGLGYTRIVTVGFSMGGAVAVRHAGRAATTGGRVPTQPVDAIVSVSSPSRWYVRDTLPMRRLHWLLETRTGRVVASARGTRIGAPWPSPPPSPVRAAEGIPPVPFLVVHGDADPYFGLSHGRALAAAGSGQLWEVPGFGHAEGALTPALADRISAWVLRAGTMRP